MVGSQQPPVPTKDSNDPFVVGQFMGMLVMLTFIEKNNGISKEALDQIKRSCTNTMEQALQKPTEDIYLMVDNLVAEIEK